MIPLLCQKTTKTTTLIHLQIKKILLKLTIFRALLTLLTFCLVTGMNSVEKLPLSLQPMNLKHFCLNTKVQDLLSPLKVKMHSCFQLEVI